MPSAGRYGIGLKEVFFLKKRLFVLSVCLLLLAAPLTAAKAEETAEPTAISDAAGLAAIALNPSGSYVLAADIDMAGVDWLPIPFGGALDGAGHTIYNLHISRLSEDTSVTYDGRHRGYHTAYASLFSYVLNAQIQNLTLLNVQIDVSTDQPAFAAGIAGAIEKATIANCSVSGRIRLNGTSRQCGVGGVAGFGNGLIENCAVDAELTVVSVNPEVKTEQYLGGVLANGYADLDGCSVVLSGYASVHGYAHHGGLIGLDDVNPKNRRHAGYVKNCTVDASISFFEDTDDRRAYCEAYIGEIQNEQVRLSGNTTVRFESRESKDFSRPLSADMDENPVYEAAVTPPKDAAFGYTTYTNKNTGYRYTDDYTAPGHTPGEWVTEREPTYQSDGVKRQYCAECGALLGEETIPKLVAVSSVTLDQTSITLPLKSAAQLTATVLPEDAEDGSVAWSSSNEAVATVDQTGLITAVGKGAATISCRSNDGFAAADCPIEVYMTTKQWIVWYVLFGWAWGK